MKLAHPIHAKAPIGAHSLAAALPMLEGKPAEDFLAQVKSDGRIHNPIVIVRHGANIGHGRIHEGPDEVLTGRQRIYFGLEAGILFDSIPTRDYDFAADGSIEDFVDREDVTGRRHLTATQRAFYAALMAKVTTQSIKDAEKAAAKAKPSKPAAQDEAESSDPAAPPKKEERASHKARKDAAKKMGVSEDAVKKAALVAKYPDLEKKVKASKITLDAAYAEAAKLKDAEKAAKNEKKIKEQRNDALLCIKNTFGENNLFTKRVISKKVFGDESRGHKDLLAFNELTLANQRAIIPLLVGGYSLKVAQEIFATKPTDDTPVVDVINYLLTQGLGTKAQSKVLDFGEYKVEFSISKGEAKRIEQLVAKQ